MTIKVSGQTPVRIDPLDFEPPLVTDAAEPGAEYAPARVLARYADSHLLKPLRPGAPVDLTDSVSGQAVDSAAVGELLAAPITRDHQGKYEHDTPQDNSAAVDFLAQCVPGVSRSGHPFLRQAFLVQGLGDLGLPNPRSTRPPIIYDADNDVIPHATELLSLLGSNGSFDDGVRAWENLTVGLGMSFTPITLGMAFVDEFAWDRFCAHVQSVCAQVTRAGVAEPSLAKKVGQFCKLDFAGSLTQALRIRPEPGVPTDDYSFARVLVNAAFAFARQERAVSSNADRIPSCSVMAFDLAELVCPESVVFVNVEQHARADADTISAEWGSIKNHLLSGFRIFSLDSITKLEEGEDTLADAVKMANETARASRPDATRRPAHFDSFSPEVPTPANLIEDLHATLERMGRVNKSMNTVRTTARTRARQSRRRPDNIDSPGKTKRTHFLPDIHYFADFSGSMSQADSRDGALTLMVFAQKYDLNFYYTSFSDSISAPIGLRVAGMSLAQMNAALSAIPKVSGGTDFTLVYNFIQEVPAHQGRMNIMATDFGWQARSYNAFRHPENLFYIPAFERSKPQAWDSVRRMASSFVNSMRPFEPDIETRLLGMGEITI